MFILNPDLDKISASHIEKLIADQVQESKYIEYKSGFSQNRAGEEKVSEKIRLLAGLSSFANTAGGDLLLGIRAEDGIPREIVAIDRGDLDQLKLTIEQLVQTGISTRINIEIREIRVSESGSVLLIRIAKSWMSPHRVTIAGHDKFYGRHSAGKYPMDLDQLRAAFAQSSGWERTSSSNA